VRKIAPHGSLLRFSRVVRAAELRFVVHIREVVGSSPSPPILITRVGGFHSRVITKRDPLARTVHTCPIREFILRDKKNAVSHTEK